MNRWRLLALIAVAGLVAAACSKSGPGTSGATTATSGATTSATTAATTGPTTAPTGGATSGGGTQNAEQLKIAVLLGGPAKDGSFDQYMVDGVQAAAKADGNTQVTVRENLSSLGSSAENATVANYARMGYDLVIAHGFDLVPGVQQAAPQFPNTAFATSLPIKGNPSNVKVYLLNFEQFGFAGGFLACQGTKNKNIGLANGPKATFDAQTLYGFQQGADMFCPGTKVQNVYGDFADSAIMKEAVTQMASQGADSIFSGVSASQPGVLAGCQSANVACWANASYAPASAPTVVLGTVNYDYGYFAPEWIQELRAGQWKGGFQFIDLKSGAISLICTDLGESKFPGLKKKCDDFNQTAKSGGFDVKPMPTSS